MKNIIIICLAILTIFSCTKPTTNTNNNTTNLQKGITYPETIYYGKNILSYADNTALTEGTEYSLGAVLEKDASLYLNMTNLSSSAGGQQSAWAVVSDSGWVAGVYNDTTDVQKFTTTKTGSIDLKLMFANFGKTGSCKIDFYENGNAITKTKHYTW